MSTPSKRLARWLIVIAVVLVVLGTTVGSVALLARTPHRGPPREDASDPAGSPSAPRRSSRLDRAGMADLALLRRVTRTTASTATATVESCVRRRGGTPIARRARTIRNCAFRPLAGAGASRGVNGMMASSLRERLLSGRCRTMVGTYDVLLTAFSSSADAVVKTNGEWGQTGPALASVARLGHWIVRYSRLAAWGDACLPARASLSGPAA